MLAFELSGEHATLPSAEVTACLEALGIRFRVELGLPRCLLVDADFSERIGQRLAMTRSIIDVLGVSDASEPEIAEMVRGVELSADRRLSFRVRVKNIGTPLSSAKLERRIGELVYDMGYSASLDNPDFELRAVLTGDKCVFGRTLSLIDSSVFERRRPQYKPFFYPGVLMPKVARVLVNLARAVDMVFDPFCGTGGILVEAGLMGIHALGSDVQRKVLLGAKLNLVHYGAPFTLMYQDARSLGLADDSVSAIACDIPYGHSAIILAGSRKELLEDSLAEMHRVLRLGKRAVVVADRCIKDEMAAAGFESEQVHRQRVHRSLTRVIHVAVKPG